MPENKIQDIANEITAYKPYTAVSLIEKALKENNAPFPEEIVYYLKRVLQGYTSIAPLRINNVTQKENKYIFDISAQPFSYLEINDVPHNVPEDSIITIEANIDEENPFPHVKFLWVPKNKKLQTSYQKPEDSEYLKKCINILSVDKTNTDINHVEVGYLFASNMFSRFFPNRPFVSIPNDISKLKITGLLSNTKYNIKGFKFTTNENGEATINEATRVAEKFNELVTDIPISFDYEGKFKDNINLKTNAQIPFAMDHSKTDLPSVFYEQYFLYEKLFSDDDNYLHHIVNNYHEPLEIEYLGETETIPVGQNSREFGSKITVDLLSKIKPDTTEIKLKIKNNFNYPWTKEINHPYSYNILNQNCIRSLTDQFAFYYDYSFEELKAFNFNGKSCSLAKNEYGYRTDPNRDLYTVDNIYKTISDTEASGAVDLLSSDNLPKNIDNLTFTLCGDKYSRTSRTFNFSPGIKSINSIKAYKKDKDCHVLINYNTSTQNNVERDLGLAEYLFSEPDALEASGILISTEHYDHL
nr:MAG TPA: hypothetical protein [Caudoviricetes sp.]